MPTRYCKFSVFTDFQPIFQRYFFLIRKISTIYKNPQFSSIIKIYQSSNYQKAATHTYEAKKKIII